MAFSHPVSKHQHKTAADGAAAGATHRRRPNSPRAISNRAASAMIQAKLTVGPADDVYEREADRVASEVMQHLQRAPHIDREDPIDHGGNMLLEQDLLQGKLVQRVSASIGLEGGAIDDQTTQQINQARGSGKPLRADIQDSMEGAFGVDFSAVRVHDGATANTLNQKIQAKAFTTGSDIFFRGGDYNPTSSSGLELLAHELTHVVQQGGAS